jgi:hypothetical protein
MKRREVEVELSKLGLDSFTVIVARHYKIAALYRGKRKMFFFSRTPSCRRALTNFTSEVRRWMRSLRCEP